VLQGIYRVLWRKECGIHRDPARRDAVRRDGGVFEISPASRNCQGARSTLPFQLGSPNGNFSVGGGRCFAHTRLQ
jgi:hypothetical protein